MYLDTVWPSEVVPRGGTLGNHQLEAGHMGKLMRRNYIDSCAKKYDSSKLQIFINEMFKKIFYFFPCILLNYVVQDSTNIF